MRSQLIPIALAFVSAGTVHGAGIPVDPPVQNHAMVRLLPGQDINAFVTELIADFDGSTVAVLDLLPGHDTYLLHYENIDPGALETALNQGYPSALAWGELVYEGQAPEGKTGSTWVDQVVESASYDGQYATSLLNLSDAHQVSTGQGILIAVLDTGIDATHPQLVGQIAAGGFNFIANSANTADAGDGQDNDGDSVPDEMVGHGTFVAGLISLVAPDAQLLPITVLNSDGVGDGWTWAKGIHYAIDRGVEVINMSLSSTYDSTVVYEALLEARSHGIVVVAAAGNLNNDVMREYPAMWDVECDVIDPPPGCPNDLLVFGVAATDHQDVKASFSNYDHHLFISAPGASVVSVPGDPVLSQSIVSTALAGEYRVWEGTSMSTALTSGAAALIRAQHPELPASLVAFNTISARLANTAVNIYPSNPPAYEDGLGAGRLDVGAAVALGPVAPDAGDLDANGSVNIDDLLNVIADWGLTHTSADINNSGLVEVDDLLIVIMNWG